MVIYPEAKERTQMSPKVLVLICAWVLGSGGAWAAELNALTDLKVASTEKGAQVVVKGSRAPTFTVFRLNEPERLVVDVSSADASRIKGHHAGVGPIGGIVASQFSDERASVARVLVSLGDTSKYDVHAEGDRVVISVDAAGAMPEPQTPATDSGTTEERKPEERLAHSSLPTPTGGEENVVSVQADEKEVRHPARKITGIRVRGDSVQIEADGEIAKYEIRELAAPPRLAIDVHGVAWAGKAPKGLVGRLKDLRVGDHAGWVRVVMEASGDMPGFRVARAPAGLKVLFTQASPGAVAATEGPKEGAPAEASAEPPEMMVDGKTVALGRPEVGSEIPVSAPPAKAPTWVDVKDLSFADDPQGGRIEIKLTGDAVWKVDHPEPRSAVLTLDSARLPKKLERSLDTSALDTPVKMVSAFTVPGADRKVRFVVVAAGAIDDAVTKAPSGLVWRIAAKGVKTEQVAVNPKAAGFTAEADGYAAEGAPRKPKYVGKKVSFEFKDIDIHNLLRVIAEISKKNIVVADDVQGKITIRLRNVPWDQALELILRSKGLGMEEMGNIVRVAPLKTLEEEAKIRDERKKALARQEDLAVQLIPVNYATANDMAPRVKDILSERGSVTVDARTNVLIVRDIASNIGRAKSLVASLDLQTPQVLIESRIVEAGTTFARQLGIQWGGRSQLAQASGNPTGLAFPNPVIVRGGAGGTAIGVDNAPDFAVNLPAAAGQGAGGALGFVFGSAGGAVALNLRLSALENIGSVKTISAPKVTTLDNNMAKISQGVSIPFSQASSSGVNTTFVEARLSLEVTPHITQDGSVLMSIKAENNQPDPANTGSNGQPAIQRKEANTQVLVKDGDTTVIGGIYVRRGGSSEAMVPFFGKIPLVGLLFKNYSESDNRQELLIFITPRIINRQTIAQNL